MVTFLPPFRWKTGINLKDSFFLNAVLQLKHKQRFSFVFGKYSFFFSCDLPYSESWQIFILQIEQRIHKESDKQNQVEINLTAT